MTSESDADFVKALVEIAVCDWDQKQFDRFFALARRGAEAAARIEQLENALREIAKVTRGWEPGVWTEEEGRKYFAGLFFSAQKVARAALGEKA